VLFRSDDVKLLADLLIGFVESKGSICDPKDKYMLYYYYGNSAYYLNDYKLAENLYNKALQMNKSNLRPKPKTVLSADCETDVTIKYNLHACLMRSKKLQEAFSILDSIPAKQRTPKILLALAKLSQTLYNKDAASHYKEALKSSKLSLVALDALLSLSVKIDELPKLPASVNVEWLNLYIKGKSHLHAREYKEAIQHFMHLDEQFMHKSADVMCSLAYSQYLNGEYASAIYTFEKLHRFEPAYTQKMDIYAFLLFSEKSDKLNVLEKLANDMHSVSLEIPETWIVIGYYNLKKKTHAMKSQADNIKCFVENALALDNDNPQALLLKALTCSKSKITPDTAAAFREVTRVNPYCFEAYKGYVENLLNLNNVKEAIQVAANAVKVIGSNHRTFTLYGEALSRDTSMQDKSKSYLYKALKSDPDNQEAVICLVKVCMTLKTFDEALEVLAKYIRYNPSNPRLMHIYIELMKKFKRHDEAIMYLNKIVGMDPSNLEVKKLLEKTEQSVETNQDETIPIL